MAKAQDFDLSKDGVSEKKPSLLAKFKPSKKMLITVLVALAVMVAAALLTVGIIKLLEREPAPEPALQPDLEALQVRVDDLEMKVQVYEESFALYRKSLEISDPAVFQAVLLQQEESYQLHLTALKQGMRDLAKMMPGSRTWLEIYDEQMDEAIRQSKDRVRELKALQIADPAPAEVISGQ